MAFDQNSLSKAAFKRINARAHTSNDKELANESIPSGITISYEDIFGSVISPTGSAAVSAGVALHLSGANQLSCTLDPSSNGKAYFLTVRSGSNLVGTLKPDGTSYSIGDRAVRIIPQSFGQDYRPVLFSNAVEVPPLASNDWFIDEYAGIITSEDNLSLLNGTVECFIYKGDYLDTTIGSGGGGGGASSAAAFVVLNATSSLSNERVLTGTNGVTLTDGGPGGNVTLQLDGTVARVSGTVFSGPVVASTGLSGSLQRLANGVTYLAGMGGTEVITGSNGQIIISSSIGGGGTTVGIVDELQVMLIGRVFL